MRSSQDLLIISTMLFSRTLTLQTLQLCLDPVIQAQHPDGNFCVDSLALSNEGLREFDYRQGSLVKTK